jgi:prophage regulatory protein
MENFHQNRFLRISEVSRITSLGKSTICLWVAQGKFPTPVKLSPTVKVWKEQELLSWIESQATEEGAFCSERSCVN